MSLARSDLFIQGAVLTGWPASLDTWFRTLPGQERGLAPDLSAGEWQTWLEVVEAHGVSPLIYTWLKSRPPEGQPPAPVVDRLRETYLHWAGYATCRWAELQELLAAMAQENIYPLVLKGAAWAELYYPSPALRPSNDIDLLVRRAEYERVKRLLLAKDYTLRKGEMRGPAIWGLEEEFMPAGPQRFGVDLHWSLSPHALVRRKMFVEPLFERAATMPNSAMRFLAPVDALVHAATHLVYAHFSNIRLIWLYDIHLLAQEIERLQAWPAVLARSQEWQARLALLVALELSDEWWGTPSAAEVKDLSHYPPTKEEWRVFEVALYTRSHGRRQTWLRWHLFQLRNLNNRQRLAYLLNKALPNRLEIDRNYPRLLSWPYPLALLGRLFLMFVSKKG
ncbi:MAG: nucleotidyltransferase family protein [Chloroflexi bacterium]|nr:nucleotidyltransferase family protein [Chloroflexota bacterium]MCI0725599.1 nucleotidyltransferase family protein [Chloroflexota bacterium]